jgi:hypothetical protein
MTFIYIYRVSNHEGSKLCYARGRSDVFWTNAKIRTGGGASKNLSTNDEEHSTGARTFRGSVLSGTIVSDAQDIPNKNGLIPRRPGKISQGRVWQQSRRSGFASEQQKPSNQEGKETSNRLDDLFQDLFQ